LGGNPFLQQVGSKTFADERNVIGFAVQKALQSGEETDGPWAAQHTGCDGGIRVKVL
jgi:hypothetical protein